jgi:polyketide synthase 12
MVDHLQHATEALRKALVQVERLKRKNRALLERSGEPIANVVAQGRDVMWEFPVDHGWDRAGLFDPDPDAPRGGRRDQNDPGVAA